MPKQVCMLVRFWVSMTVYTHPATVPCGAPIGYTPTQGTWEVGFTGDSDGKESACNVGDLGSIPGLGRAPGEGNGFPLQYSGLENSMGTIVHGVAKSRT